MTPRRSVALRLTPAEARALNRLAALGAGDMEADPAAFGPPATRAAAMRAAARLSALVLADRSSAGSEKA